MFDIYKKITSAEKMINNSPLRLLKISGNCGSKTKLVIKQNSEAIEEFKVLKDNIEVSAIHNYSLAYQPIVVRNKE